MNRILKQRRFLLTKVFELTDRSLKVATKTPVSKIEQEFAFETIDINFKKKVTPHIPLLIGTIFFFILTVISLNSHYFEKVNGSSWEDISIFAVMLIILGSLLALNYQNLIVVTIEGRYTLEFFATIPNRYLVAGFLEELRSSQKYYMVYRYTDVSVDFTFEQLTTNLRWLWNKGIINTEEYNTIKNKHISSTITTNTGFQFKIFNN